MQLPDAAEGMLTVSIRAFGLRLNQIAEMRYPLDPLGRLCQYDTNSHKAPRNGFCRTLESIELQDTNNYSARQPLQDRQKVQLQAREILLAWKTNDRIIRGNFLIYWNSRCIVTDGADWKVNRREQITKQGSTSRHQTHAQGTSNLLQSTTIPFHTLLSSVSSFFSVVECVKRLDK